jgi:hypothetical protein
MSSHTYNCSNCDFTKSWKGTLAAKKNIVKAHAKKCGKATVERVADEPTVKYAKRTEPRQSGAYGRDLPRHQVQTQKTVNIMEIVGRRFLRHYVEFVQRNESNFGMLDGIARGWQAYTENKHKHKSVGECLTTKDIIPKKLADFCDHEAFREPELLTIDPELPPLMCYQNAGFLEKQYDGRYKAINGFNATACECGSMMSFELHTVVVDFTKDEYIDFTRDFCGEKKKWFIPFTNQRADARTLQGALNVGTYTYNSGNELGVPCSGCGFDIHGKTDGLTLIETAEEFGDEILGKTRIMVYGGARPYR